MTTYTIGEEVLYDDERYILAAKTYEEPVRYRLLASTPKGARVVWVNPQQLRKISKYTTPKDDTARY